MIAALLFPDLPALALNMALGSHKQVLVHSGGRVVAPASLAGMHIHRAMALRPQACPLSRQPALERSAWEHILENVFSFTPFIADGGLGRLFCAPDNLQALRTLISTTGACAGLAPTRTLALLAALSTQPGSMRTVDTDDIATFLDEVPVVRLQQLPELEINDAMVERLRLFGMPTLGRIRRLTRSQLTAQFGTAGSRLHELLHSIGDANPLPMYVPASVVESAVLLDDATREPSVLLSLLRSAVDTCVQNLGQQRTGRVEVALLDKANSVTVATSRILRATTNDTVHISAQTAAMLATLTASLPSCGVYGIRLRLGSLSILPPRQTTLFPPRPALSDIATPLAKRFPSIIKRISVLDANAYMPDRFAALEPWKGIAEGG